MNIGNNAKEDLKNMIDGMDFDLKQKIMWYHFIEVSRDKDVQSILEVAQEDPKNLDFLLKNMQDKVAALAGQDVEKWDQIIAEEEKFLKEK